MGSWLWQWSLLLGSGGTACLGHFSILKPQGAGQVSWWGPSACSCDFKSTKLCVAHPTICFLLHLNAIIPASAQPGPCLLPGSPGTSYRLFLPLTSPLCPLLRTFLPTLLPFSD